MPAMAVALGAVTASPFFPVRAMALGLAEATPPSPTIDIPKALEKQLNAKFMNCAIKKEPYSSV